MKTEIRQSSFHDDLKLETEFLEKQIQLMSSYKNMLPMKRIFKIMQIAMESCPEELV